MKDQLPYDAASDEALCARVSSGDRKAEEALVLRYGRLVRVCARPFFLLGGDSEDLIQEGMLGLLKAVREFDPSRAASFRTFAALCIRSRLLSAVKEASQDKHRPLNNSISFETPFFDWNSDSLANGAEPQSADPETALINREEVQERLDRVRGQLSGFEANVLGYYLSGLTSSEIASALNRSPKSVDNAVQRIRRKFARQA